MTSTTHPNLQEDPEFDRLLHSIPDPLVCDQCKRNVFVRYITADVDQTVRQKLCYYCKWPDACEYDYAPPSIQREVQKVAESIQKVVAARDLILNLVYRRERKS